MILYSVCGLQTGRMEVHGTWDASEGAEGDSYSFLPSLKDCGHRGRSPMTGKRQMSHLKGDKVSEELQAGWPNLERL